MISVYDIKPKFQALLKPVLQLLYKAGISANAITLAAIALSCVTGIAIWLHPYGSMFILLPLVLLLRMALNALDGMMARTYNMQSRTGEVLNELGDVFSDFVLFFPLLKLFSLNINVLIAFLFLSLLNEFAGLLGKVVSGVRRYEGPMGKSDRALAISLFSLLLFFAPTLINYSNHVFVVFIFLLLISTLLRIQKSIKHTQV